MKRIEELSEGVNHTAVDIGSLDELKSYSFIHPKTGKDVNGKVFLKEPTGATGTEISFTALPPKTELGYFHLHNKDEETYIILKGTGYYQVDDSCFSIKPGSVIRVAPKGVRSLCNTSNEEMVYICVQSKAGSLEEYSTVDGSRIEHVPKWRKP